MDEHKKERFRKGSHWVGCPLEADLLGEDRKRGKTERKHAEARDRSKYKKSDRDQQKKRTIQSPQGEHLLRGRVLSITSQGFVVDHAGEQLTCSLKGTLKKEKTQFKNLVAVGDWVLFEKQADKEGWITHIEPRHTVLSRADNLSQKKEQLIATNIDQVMITVSVLSPSLKPALIDRYVIAAFKGNMTPIIVVNKIDLLQDPEGEPFSIEAERELYLECLKAYAAANLTIIPVSTVTGEGIDALREIMKDKTSVFSGQSGVGKSSLLNLIAGLDLRTGHIVEKTQKGTHTTTTTRLLPLPFGGWCIDTPGIKSFGVWNLKKEEIESYFSEIATVGQGCKFANCTHTHEQECAVRKAVEEGAISWLRYTTYESLIESAAQEHLRR